MINRHLVEGYLCKILDIPEDCIDTFVDYLVGQCPDTCKADGRSAVVYISSRIIVALEWSKFKEGRIDEIPALP